MILEVRASLMIPQSHLLSPVFACKYRSPITAVPSGFANEIFFFNVGPEDGPTIEAREVTIVSTTDDSIVANPSKMP